MVADWFNTIRLSRILIVAYSTLFLLCVWFVSLCWRYPINNGYWIAGHNDDYGHLRQELWDLDGSDPSLYFIASSAFREAIISESSLESSFPSHNVHLLTAGDLLPLEMLQMVSLLPKDHQGVVFIEVSHRHFSLPPDKTKFLAQHSRLGVDSVRSHIALSKLNIFVPWGLSTAIFYGSRLDLKTPFTVPKEDWVFHQVDLFEPKNFHYGHSVQKVQTWVKESSIHGDWNQKIYEHIIDAIPENMQLVFVRSPRNPDIFYAGSKDLVKEVQLYEQRLQKLGEYASAPIWYIDTGVSAQQYYDHGHINTNYGRKIATGNLVELIEHFLSLEQR